MTPVAHFEKVSYEVYKEEILKYWDNPEETPAGVIENIIRNMYDKIQMPIRSTSGSAGYDFFTPAELQIPSDRSIIIPTGIRCKIDDGYFLGMYPRSGLGFKYRVALDNTVGIIDADYYNSDNEGHIILKLHAEIPEGTAVTVPEGKAYAQGIFQQFFVIYEDRADGIRNGGFGSTTENN